MVTKIHHLHQQASLTPSTGTAHQARPIPADTR